MDHSAEIRGVVKVEINVGGIVRLRNASFAGHVGLKRKKNEERKNGRRRGENKNSPEMW